MSTSNPRMTAVPKVVSREDWLAARRALLEHEKTLTALRDKLTAERQALPWVKIDKTYTFEGPLGPITLGELFQGRSQLFIKHFMMGPGQPNHCVGCFLEVDHLAGILVHLENHDVGYAAVARAPINEIEAVRKRMGWTFPWVSSYGSAFNYDFDVSFRRPAVEAGHALYNFAPAPAWAGGLEDLSGNSVFFKDDSGQIFHTYSTYGRGGEQFLGIYGYLDVMPNGRAENGPHHSLADWARPHDKYGLGGTVEATGRYHSAGCTCVIHE